jgi:hypothetical protein
MSAAREDRAADGRGQGRAAPAIVLLGCAGLVPAGFALASGARADELIALCGVGLLLAAIQTALAVALGASPRPGAALRVVLACGAAAIAVAPAASIGAGVVLGLDGAALIAAHAAVFGASGARPRGGARAARSSARPGGRRGRPGPLP